MSAKRKQSAVLRGDDRVGEDAPSEVALFKAQSARV
jgi:hypothetical protein